jgi:hypothetical protein
VCSSAECVSAGPNATMCPEMQGAPLSSAQLRRRGDLSCIWRGGMRCHSKAWDDELSPRLEEENGGHAGVQEVSSRLSSN